MKPRDESKVGTPAERWVDAWQAGSEPEKNFKRLFDQYSGILFAFFRKRGLSLEECDDMVQESFLGVHRGLSHFRREVPFENWLFELATNVFRKRLRFHSAKKRTGQEEPLSDLIGPRDDTERAVAADPEELGRVSWAPRIPPAALRRLLGKERLRSVLQGLDELPPQMRRCAVLAWCDGYSNQEVATLLKISTQTVKVQHLKARRRLREYLLTPVEGGS